MSETLNKLEGIGGKRFCLVYMELIDMEKEQVKLTPVYGTARLHSDKLLLVEKDGNELVVPESALASVYASDGSEILKDAEYYVVVKVGHGISPK
ncbi:hypothetical protein BVX97_04720 [bacterium E08(2017)]|nr:hypothetical protein BVX97_04720 [bacterium E08(2017)]